MRHSASAPWLQLRQHRTEDEVAIPPSNAEAQLLAAEHEDTIECVLAQHPLPQADLPLLVKLSLAPMPLRPAVLRQHLVLFGGKCSIDAGDKHAHLLSAAMWVALHQVLELEVTNINADGSCTVFQDLLVHLPQCGALRALLLTACAPNGAAQAHVQAIPEDLIEQAALSLPQNGSLTRLQLSLAGSGEALEKVVPSDTSSHLTLDGVRLGRISRDATMQLLAVLPQPLRRLRLADDSWWRESAVSYVFSELTGLQRLDVSLDACNTVAWRNLSALTQLTALSMLLLTQGLELRKPSTPMTVKSDSLESLQRLDFKLKSDANWANVPVQLKPCLAKLTMLTYLKLQVAGHLSAVLADMASLRALHALDLSGSDVMVYMHFLASDMPHLTALTALDLSCCEVGPRAHVLVCTSLQRLQKLDFAYNLLGGGGMLELKGKLTSLRALTWLRLGGNGIGASSSEMGGMGLVCLRDLALQLPCLAHLDIGNGSGVDVWQCCGPCSAHARHANIMTASAAVEWAEVLAGDKMPSLQCLDVRYMNMDEASVKVLLSACSARRESGFELLIDRVATD